MKSERVVWTAVSTAEVQEFEIGSPGPGEVLVEVAYSLVSPGTERGWLTGVEPLPFRTGSPFPMYPGYAVSGVVLEVGDGVSHLAAGDRVVGMAPHARHGLGRADDFTRVPEGVPLDEATFFHLGFVSMNGVRRARVELGERVVVLGLGLVGLIAVQAARWQGALPLIGVDVVPERLELARRAGADLVIDGRDAAALAGALEAVGGPQVVVEATAAKEPLRSALAMVRPMGRVVLLSSKAGEMEADLFGGVHMKGTTLIGAQTMRRPRVDSQPGLWTWQDDATAYLEMIRYGRIDVRPFITHRVPGERAPEVYELVAAGDPALIGGLFAWNEG